MSVTDRSSCVPANVPRVPGRAPPGAGARLLLPGGFLYESRHIVDWCGNGTTATSVRQNQGISWDTGFGVEYKGSTAGGNGAGRSTTTQWAQGNYEYCAVKWTLCNTKYPRHEGVYRANGTWSTVSSSAG